MSHKCCTSRDVGVPVGDTPHKMLTCNGYIGSFKYVEQTDFKWICNWDFLVGQDITGLGKTKIRVARLSARDES